MSFRSLAPPPDDPHAAVIWDPLVVSPETAVLDAIAQMDHSAASRAAAASRLCTTCVVVVAQRQVVGILTERDVVTLVTQQRPLQGGTLAEVMTHPVITLPESALTDWAVAIQRLQQHQIDHLPIVDGQGVVVGVVTYESLHQAVTQPHPPAQMAGQQTAETARGTDETHPWALSNPLPDLTLRVNRTGIYLEVVTTPDFQLVGGLPELVGTHVSESLPPPIARQRMAMIEQALQTRATQVYEQNLSTPNNTHVEEVRVVPYGEDEVLLLVRDISEQVRLDAERQRLAAERERAEAALLESEQTNRAILEAIPDLLIRMDRQGNCSQISGGGGVQVHEPATSSASVPDRYQILPPALAKRQLAFVHQALDTGQLQIYEQIFDVEGDRRCEEVRITPLNGHEVLIMVRDITERARLEADRERTMAALEASEQRFRQLFEATPQISVQGYDRDRRVIYWNPASEQLYGYSAAEALGQKLEDLIVPPEMRAWVVTAVGDWVAGGAAIPASELTLMDRHGSPVDVFSSHVMLNNLAGEPEMYCVDINLSPLKQARNQLQQLNQTLEAKVIERTTALEEREARYRALVNVIPDLLIRIDANGTYLDAIAGEGVELFNPEQFKPGVNIYDVTPFDHAQERMGYVHQALQTRKVQSYDYDLIIDGRQVSEAARIVAINDTEALIIVQDISERARLKAEVADRTAALQASEAQLRAIIEAIPDLLLRVTLDGTCLGSMYPSDDSQEFLPIQFHLSEVLPPPLLQQQLYYIGQAAATGTLQIYEHQLQKGDRTVYEEVRVSAIGPDQALLMIRDVTQRKHIERALHESQRFLQTVLDTVPLPIFWKDRNSVFLGGTQKLLDAVGLQSEADLIGKTDFDLAATQDRAIAYRADDQQVMASGMARLGIEETLMGPDGQQRWLETHKAPLRDWAGEIIGVVGVFQDITQRKQFELALRASEERYRSIYDQTAMGLANANLSGQFLQVNPRFCDMLGYSQAELIGKSIRDITHPDDLEQITPDMQRLFAGEIAHFFQEKRYRRKDGSHFWSSTSISMVRDALGQPAHTLAVIRDISDRKQAEMALQAKTEELDRFFALALDLLCIVDSEGRFVRLNYQWEQTLGHPLAEIQGNRYMDYVHPEDVESTLAAGRQLAENKSIFGFANRHRCRDGSYRWLEWHSVLNQGLIYATARDITDRKQVEAELQAKTREIQQAYQDLQSAQLQLVQSEKMSSLGQLVAGIAHEINNPVGFIYGNLSIAFNYVQDLGRVLALYQSHYMDPPPEIKDAIKTADVDYVLEDFPKLLSSIENGAVRIRDIVTSLRTFSQLNQAERKSIDIHTNIDSTLVILQSRLNGRSGKPQIQVIKNYGELPPIECYGSSLNQVFMNLLVNAIDAIELRQDQATHDYGGCITITTRIAPNNTVAIAIRDN
ncbi:MAG: PAS domain S-box protein, partial [Leptolyngbya sp.]|nr:PAS domain S-box protein [Leptolyngbya sp.]